MKSDNQGDSSASTEVESSNRVLDQNSLAAMISASRVPKSKEVEPDSEQEGELSEVSEALEGVEESEESIENETQSQEVESEDEEHDEDDDDADEDDHKNDVLSKREKALNKLRNRNKKLTKNWRTAEEKIEALEQEVNQLKSKTSDSVKRQEGLVSKVESAESFDDLVQIKETAELIVSNAEELLDEMIDNGDSEIEFNGKVFDRNTLRSAKKEAEEVLKNHIKNKASLLEQRSQFDEAAKAQFEFYENPDSEEFKFVEQIMADKEFNKFLNGRPEQFYILGLLAEGQKSLNARRSGQQSQKEKGKTEETHKAISTPKIAPSVPGLKGGVAPARASGDQIAQNKRKEILSRNRLDTTGLAQLISASKHKT